MIGVAPLSALWSLSSSPELESLASARSGSKAWPEFTADDELDHRNAALPLRPQGHATVNQLEPADAVAGAHERRR